MEKLKVSVLIVHYNCWPYLKKNLISIQRQSEPVNQIIIINNGSLVDLDQEISVFNDLPIELVHNTTNVGFGAACNQAAKMVPDDSLMLFCNPDVEIPSSGIELLCKSHRQSGIDILGCKQVNSKGKLNKYHGVFPTLKSLTPLLGRLYKNIKAPEATIPNGVLKVEWITGSVVLVLKKTFEKLKGFDEDYFMFMEDVDLCKRANESGFSVGVTDEIEWAHHHGKSSVSNVADRAKSKTEAIKSKHTYVRKHFKKMKILGHVFLSFKYFPELFLALILGVFIPAKEIKVKQAVAINLIKSIYQPAVKTVYGKMNI